MHREIVPNAKAKMKAGIDEATDLVKVTMGVRGKTVVLKINPYGKPMVTNDGVTVLRELKFEDKVKDAGLDQLKEASEKTNDNAGDGTTTTAILMQSIIDQGMKAISTGADGIALREGIKKGTDNIIKYLETEKVDASEEATLADVATISCRDPKIGKLIAKIVQQAGTDGVITLEDRLEADTTYDKMEGLKLRGGYLHEMFINSAERRQSVFSDVPILVTTKAITTGPEIMKIFDSVASMGKKQAILIASSIEGDALANIVVNWQKNLIHVLPLRVMAYGEAGLGAMKDVAAITGGTFLDENEKNITDITDEDFGRADKVVTDKNETTVVTNDDMLKKERILELEVALNDEATAEFEKESLRERIAKLKSAMFRIKVGGRTDTERNELKTRIDDALKSAKAALESGVIAGGGSALFRAVQAQKQPNITTDEGIGEKVLYQACVAPLQQMADNTAYTLDRTDFEQILDKEYAVDFKTCQVVKAFESGIVDPLKVVVESVRNASSQAALFLTMDSVVVSTEESKVETL